jgi:site-specific DNA-methyltransferase (adenine-specific)
MGMDYMGAIIWQKVTTTNTSGGATIMGSFPYPRNGILKIDYEFILLFKRLGDPPAVSKEIKERSKLTTVEWNTYFAGHWNFAGEKQDKHLAMFPEELPRRLIRMFSFAGDTVLDPFLGSGTTSLAARKLDRNSVGYEIQPSFAPIIKTKLEISRPGLFRDATIDFVARRPAHDDISTAIASLPYKFSDPHMLDTKIDPRKQKFGSRIEEGDNGKMNALHVSEIISPELLRLSNRTIIRLMGIKENPASRKEAVNFLTSKTKGQKVFLRHDQKKHDENGNLLCYVYLKNKTFINAHLIRSGFVHVDNDHDYRLRQKFLNLFDRASVSNV